MSVSQSERMKTYACIDVNGLHAYTYVAYIILYIYIVCVIVHLHVHQLKHLSETHFPCNSNFLKWVVVYCTV